ncbi:uncharacterized protein LOC143484796 [Brachyhypopomus gauderio]|uniref:uncharacterized protein LOC143484796 n=1 Tax=Brachyhypopomus gauderio TaxID=698409 RepID=UPI0040437767
MDGEVQGDAGLLQKFKPQLIDALSGDADFVLQNCHSLFLLSQREYDHVKATAIPSQQVRDILDYMMTKNDERIQTFLELLKKDEMQKTFPKLQFLKELRETRTAGEKSRKKTKEMPADVEDVPQKQLCKPVPKVVSEKQLMLVARCIGSSWKEVARVALDLPSTRLEQIAEENPRNHRECVFAALRFWRMRERDRATGARLHHLLTQEEGAVDPGSIDFLLGEN